MRTPSSEDILRCSKGCCSRTLFLTPISFVNSVKPSSMWTPRVHSFPFQLQAARNENRDVNKRTKQRKALLSLHFIPFIQLQYKHSEEGLNVSSPHAARRGQCNHINNVWRRWLYLHFQIHDVVVNSFICVSRRVSGLKGAVLLACYKLIMYVQICSQKNFHKQMN